MGEAHLSGACFLAFPYPGRFKMVLGSLLEEAVSPRRRWHCLAMCAAPSGAAVTPSLTALIPRELHSLPAAQ